MNEIIQILYFLYILRMANAVFFRLRNAFQPFNCLLFPFFFNFVLNSDPNLNVSEVIKISLRPLKYSKSCAVFCDNIMCQPINECNDGVILKNETYCECCEACVKYLDIGEKCTDKINGSLSLGLQSRCKIGTTCENGTCQLNTKENSCLRHRDIKRNHNQTGNYANRIWIPQCDEDGYYAAKQKKITKSICVNKLGKKLFGSADDLSKTACACSQLMEENVEKNPISLHLKPQVHCLSSGSFDTLQCINNLCYCVERDTGGFESELVRLDFLHKLHCFNMKLHRKQYLKDCETELQRTKKLAYEFWKKEVQFYSIYVVKCDPDGTFSPKQCLPDRCVCTDKEGIGIRQYYSELIKTFINNMTCNCAREEKSTAFMSLSCETYGSYKSLSCFNGKCFCVDEDGDLVSKELKSSEEISCDKFIKNISEYHYNEDDDDASFTDYNKYNQ